MRIKVTVDYTNGCYNVVGYHKGEGKNHQIYKSIKSYSYNSRIIYENHYNKAEMNKRKNRVKREINKIIEQEPNFKFSKKSLSEVDTLIYEALDDWDKLLGNHTNYATLFLRSTMQEFDKNNYPRMSSRRFKKECVKEREKALKDVGIDITYNVGLFNTSKNINLLDKIKGIIIAQKQKKFLGANVINHLILKEAVFIKDNFLNFKDDIDNKTAQKEKNKVNRFSKIKERIKLPKRFFRKISNLKDSIKNKKISTNSLKRIAIKGAATLFAVGGITATAKVGGTLLKNYNNSKNTKYETEYNADNKKDIFSENFMETEVQTEKETFATETEVQTEKETFATETEVQTEKETSVTETEAQTEKETFSTETKTQNEKENNKKKLKKFKKDAIQTYKEAFIIGEKPKVGNLLNDKKYGENPDGSGNVGKFATHPNYQVDHILVMTDSDWYTVETDGKNLAEVLDEYPDEIGYSIHFSNTETDGGLGFVTQSELETMIKNKVNSIIENKRNKKIKKMKQVNEDVIR